MNSKAPKIFVVDDDPYFRIAVVGILRANGYQVAVESRPLSVINSIKKERPDLILLDLRMPKVGGMEVIKTMRRLSLYTPVVIISGHLSHQNFQKLRGLGVKHFLVKPIDLKTLLAKVKEAIEVRLASNGNQA